MLNPIASLCVYMTELVITYIFFSELCDHRMNPLKCFLIGAGLFSIGSALNLLLGNNGFFNATVTFFLVFLFSISCFRISWTQSVFYTAILLIGNMVFELAPIAIGAFLTDNAFQDYNYDLVLFLLEAVTSKSMFYLFVLITTRVIRLQGVSPRVPLNFLIHPLVSTFCLFVFWYVCTRPGCTHQVQLLLMSAAICMFASSIALFLFYSRQMEKDNEALQTKSELTRLQTEQAYYHILEQQNQQLLIYAHDAKKHLSAIQALNEDAQIGNYVTALSEQLANYSRNCHSGNKLLDVMIHKYAMECSIRQIRFEYDIKVCNLSQLEDIDLVAILGNLLDNAVAAAEESSEKTISLSTVHRNTYSIIILSNSCDTPPKTSGNRLVSTKSDDGPHGLGLKSVAKAIHKYHGDYEWDYDSVHKSFTITVMIADNF